MLAASSLRPYVRPKLYPQGTGLLDLKQVRHPCVELQDSMSYIPNDAYFKQGNLIFFYCNICVVFYYLLIVNMYITF